jgi:hypothetical protein
MIKAERSTKGIAFLYRKSDGKMDGMQIVVL